MSLLLWLSLPSPSQQAAPPEGGKKNTNDSLKKINQDKFIRVEDELPKKPTKINSDKIDTAISNLIVQSGKNAGEVLLNWKVKESNTSPIIIKRHIRQMSTFRLFIEGKSILKKPLAPQTKSYLEENVSVGVYYYAVVTQKELEAKKIFFTIGKNSIEKPFILFEAGKAPPALLPPKGKRIAKKENILLLPEELIALDARNSVILTWIDAPSLQKDISYQIYRSSERLHTKKALASATLIGTTQKRRYQFIDEKPVKDTIVYYGVVSKKSLEHPKFNGLQEFKSYIKHRYVPQVPKIIRQKQKTSFGNLEHILLSTYLQKKYKQCVGEIQNYLFQEERKEELKAKASFFLGLCHYKEASYRDALTSFAKPIVKKKYPKRSVFWFERSAEGLGI